MRLKVHVEISHAYCKAVIVVLSLSTLIVIIIILISSKIIGGELYVKLKLVIMYVVMLFILASVDNYDF